MRISYEWLSDYVDTNGLSPHGAAEILTMSGTKIESVQVLDLSAIIVGRVLEQKDHPSSNKPLWVHQVDLGGGSVIQIIAGAPNAVAGTLVPVALPGTRVPSGTLVRDAKIAGEAGQGMLCSADELLLGEDREPKIMLLDRGEPGESLAKYIPPDVMLEHAKPTHVFDAGKLAGKQLHVREARDGESLLCLDGQTRKLGPGMLVVADATGPVAIGGIIGGEDSGVSDTTTDVVIESAGWDGVNIRATSRALGLRTDASLRHEKGLA